MKIRFVWTLVFVGLLISCSKNDEIVTPPVVLSDVKAIKTFTFSVSRNPELKQNIAGEISGDTIFATTFSGTDLTSLIPDFSFTGKRIVVQNTPQQSGVTANDFSSPVHYIAIAEDSSTKTYTVKFRDTGLPVIYISTSGVPITSKDDYVDAAISVTQGISGKTIYEGVTGIRGRGNSTWGMAKKPYRLKLDKKTALLGMTSGKNWVLLANYADKSLIRNELAFSLSRVSGLAYTPASRFAEVVLNGEYLGNYLITEQIKEGENQVDIEEQSDGAASLPEISGGYMLEEDGFAAGEPVHFYSPRNMPITVKYPDDDVITDAQKSYIAGHIALFENALFADNFTDPAEGYRKYFDVDSYVNYYIVNEVLGNPDMYWSTCYYKKRNDDRLYSGPVWDFDIACNNDLRLGNAVNSLMLSSAHEPKLWINRLMEDPAFRQKIRARWNELKSSVDNLNSWTDELAKQLSRSQKTNFQRWDILSQKVYLEYQVAGSYAGEIEFLKAYFNSRIPWLDARFNSSYYQ